MGASKTLQGVKAAVSDLATKLVQMVSNAKLQGLHTLSMIQTTIKDKFLYIVCQGQERFVVLKLNIAQIVEYMQSKSAEVYGATRARIIDTCSAAKARVIKATDVTKTKALETSSNIRIFAANPSARAGAAGAVALGASGGVTGLFAGAAVGAACAVPAAFFTFGMSIPVGAAL